MDKEMFKGEFVRQLQAMHGKSIAEASVHEQYTALGSMVREYICENWKETNRQYQEKEEKQVYYFSIEFLMGKLLDMNLVNMGLKKICSDGLGELGIDLEQLIQEEPDAGLGNGGLGRLAACILDSMAASGLPGHGCGIRYKYGLFEQKIVNNYQVELPDNWLKDGYIWEYRKADKAVEVHFGGTVYCEKAADGNLNWIQENYEKVLAVPYDIPIVGYTNNTVNTLRLWSAESSQTDVDLASFNRGDYLKAAEYRHSVARISKILYPDDSFFEGRLLRLKQEYFFVSAGLQSIIRNVKGKGYQLKKLPDKVAVHINDTHPALVIPELMRILMDEERMGWDEAWDITVRTVSYTNHTIMPEALEKWPVDMLSTLLPRIYLIICEINERLCKQLWNQRPGDWDRIREMSIIEDDQVYMARLAVVGSHSVNGVAKLHSEILKKHTLRRFFEVFPLRFNNKTNGVTHRRWLLKANPELSELITESIGSGWIKHPDDLMQLLPYAQDRGFCQQLSEIKKRNKQALADYIQHKYDVKTSTEAIFDVQIKRIHAYKRQILNVLHVMHLYNLLRENPGMDMVPRVYIFAGKAAPGYYIAKQTIKLISLVSSIINKDKSIGDKLKVIFLENYSVSLGEIIFPAADVSEQISTASKEASGTGNMKFMMNGALTIGTLDGANIEIREAVGDDNIFIFGLTAQEVMNYYQYGGYNAWDIYNGDVFVKTVMEQLVNGFFPDEKEEFSPLYEALLRNNDEFFVLKDFPSYRETQLKLEATYRKQQQWQNMCVHNIAHSGVFSSDRTVSEYAIGIWNVKPTPIH